MDELELMLVGMVMAATIYCDEPGNSAPRDDQTEDFDLWRASWDATRPRLEARAMELGWVSVGMNWEYHPSPQSGA